VTVVLGSCTDDERGASARGLDPGSDGRPAIRFPETVFDFGTIFQRETASHTFPFESVGSKPVRITGVKSDCACTIPRYTREPVPPGESGEVSVLFDAGLRFGPIKKELRIDTDDPDQARLVLTVTGTVKREFWIEPARILLDSLRPGVPVGEHVFRIHWLPEVDLQVTGLEATDESIRVLRQEPFEDERSRGIAVTVTVEDWEEALERAKSSVYSQFVVVKTDHEKYAQTMLPLTGGRFEPVRWEPKVLMLGVVPAGQEVEKTVTLSTPRGIDLEIEKLESPDYIEMSVVPSATDSPEAKPGITQTLVRVKLLPTAPAGLSFKEHLRIHTNLEDRPVVSVYVYGKIE
jgi:hypothetical protein